jgi:opacity protein-like surface antigen
MIVYAGASLAHADSNFDRSYIASASIGANFFDLSDNFGDVDIETSTEFMFSWAFEYRFHEKWGAEVRWAGSSGDVKLKSSGLEADIDPMYFNGNVLYHFTSQSRIIPFVTAGLGMAVLDIDRDNSGDSETNLAFNFGGGAWIIFNDRFAMSVEIRDYIYSVNGLSEDSAAALDLPTDFEATMNDIAVLSGIVIGF